MRLPASFASLAILATLAACSSEAATPVGAYAVEMEFDTTGMPEDQVAMARQMMPSVELNILANGTWTLSSVANVMGQSTTSSAKGTWVLDGGNIVMTQTHEDGQEMDEPDVKTAPYANGAFSITHEEGGQTIKMNAKKKDA